MHIGCISTLSLQLQEPSEIEARILQFRLAEGGLGSIRLRFGTAIGDPRELGQGNALLPSGICGWRMGDSLAWD